MLNEGTSVLRPADAIEISPKVYRILESNDYDHEDEEWEFPPGSIVECSEEIREGENILVAKKEKSE